MCLLKDDHFLLKLMSGMGGIFNILVKSFPDMDQGLEDFKKLFYVSWDRQRLLKSFYGLIGG